MSSSLKKIALFLTACIAFGWILNYLIESDPHHDEVINFVKNDPQVARHISSVKSLKVLRVTKYSASRANPGYAVYSVRTSGEHDSILVTVEMKINKGEATGFRIRDIDP